MYIQSRDHRRCRVERDAVRDIGVQELVRREDHRPEHTAEHEDEHA